MFKSLSESFSKELFTNFNFNTIRTYEQNMHLVYKLYDLTYDEVLIVDPESSITREEYDG